MKNRLIQTILVIATFVALTHASLQGCVVAPKTPLLAEGPQPDYSRMKAADAVDWRDKAALIQHGNQHLPQWCGSCWAHATTAMVSDRFRIHLPDRMKFTRLSVQALLNCGVEFGIGSCSGGSWEKALTFMYNNYLVDETCMPTMGLDRSVNHLTTCLDHMCRDCDVYGNCTSVKNYERYQIYSWGYVKGAENMTKEISNRGPIVCYIYSHTPQYLNYKGGIIDDDTQLPPDLWTHVVEVVGYGTEAGKDYWIVRNSFGTRWGEGGFFRIVRGKNQLNIESNCGWAEPSK